MNSCKFCETFDFYKQIMSDPLPFHTEKPITMCDEYTVAMVIHHWYKDRGKKSASRTTNYRYRGLGFKLRYCPECGKKLRGVKCEKQRSGLETEKVEQSH